MCRLSVLLRLKLSRQPNRQVGHSQQALLCQGTLSKQLDAKQEDLHLAIALVDVGAYEFAAETGETLYSNCRLMYVPL